MEDENMTDFLSTGGTPVRNLQNMLREISLYYNNIPLLIADGIFGERTTNAVRAFQTAYSLPVTGEVDIITFEEIVRVKRLAEEGRAPFKETLIIADPDHIIYPGMNSKHLYVIKAMVKNISSEFDNIGDIEITDDFYDDNFATIIKQIQRLSYLEPTGIIDKKTFNIISYLYEVVAS